MGDGRRESGKDGEREKESASRYQRPSWETRGNTSTLPCVVFDDAKLCNTTASAVSLTHFCLHPPDITLMITGPLLSKTRLPGRRGGISKTDMKVVIDFSQRQV